MRNAREASPARHDHRTSLEPHSYTNTNGVDVYIFGRSQNVQSLRGAVVSLGFHHVSDIAMSCGVLNLGPGDKTARIQLSSGSAPWDAPGFAAGWHAKLNLTIRQSVPCRSAARFGNHRPSLGFAQGIPCGVGNRQGERDPAAQAGQSTTGFSHCDSGRLLAERWQLAPALIEVMSHHHVPEKSVEHAGFVALVPLADLLCRMSGLNYGYVEQRQMDLAAEPGFALLAEHFTTQRDLTGLVSPSSLIPTWKRFNAWSGIIPRSES